ncbi:Leucine--tRNA ligase, cytoplasmic, partial [Aduncisulcus paluster]
MSKVEKLKQLEKKWQEAWEAEKAFEADPEDGKEKFFTTFPYPYMNGRLHLGHLFSASKAEYVTGHQSLMGKNALWPFGFHGTGMPIVAAALKLKEEIDEFGCPPVFPEDEETVVQTPHTKPEEEKVPEDITGKALGQFKTKKSKLAAKTGNARQWTILESMGVDVEEIPKFVEAKYWLQYFPPIAMEDMKAFGARVDWRRSFITTDMNPYYDSFIRWHFTTLKERGKVKFGKRISIYSPKDKQECADHARAKGEGVGPTEYSMILLKVKDISMCKPLAHLADKDVYLGAGTLRPETMYGQTNCWALPTGEYGAYELEDGRVIIVSDYAGKNLAFQDHQCKGGEFGETRCLGHCTGSDLFGVPLRAPRTSYDTVYVLPLLTISMSKGTGIVTSVPSDAPDDYAALKDLMRKPLLREKFGLKDEWVMPYEVVEIIEISDLGKDKVTSTRSAVYMCDEELKVQSQHDHAKLVVAKQECYESGFYKGKMIIDDVVTVAGKEIPLKGMAVSDAKEVVRDAMIEAKECFMFSVADKEVVSRSGDQCVCALVDQWYIDYSELEWQNDVFKTFKRDLDTFCPEIRNSMRQIISWLGPKSVSRIFGLGTRIPWDTQFLIESLSDSTIYMAFYTVSHLLQGGVLDGKGDGKGTIGVAAETMDNAAWDAVMLKKPLPEGHPLTSEQLEKLRREFNYWYPVDIRVSGKDLVYNHLVMALYNHVAIWGCDDQSKMIKGIRANGHLLLDGEKMSKQKGNFLTAKQAIDLYGADAVRLTLATSGDGVEDANFKTDEAKAAALKMAAVLQFAEHTCGLEVADDEEDEEEIRHRGVALRPIDSPLTLLDEVCLSQINSCIRETIAAFDRCLFARGVKYAMYEMLKVRDQYRNHSLGNMHTGVAREWLRVHALLMAPITSHYSEEIHRNILGLESVQKTVYPLEFPVMTAEDKEK